MDVNPNDVENMQVDKNTSSGNANQEVKTLKKVLLKFFVLIRARMKELVLSQKT